jgi:hypothetical protein
MRAEVAMPMDEEPVVGAVYENTEGRTFEVVGFDEDEGTVKIEFEDGSVEELDIDTWYELDLKQIESGDQEDEDDYDDSDEDEDSEYLDEDEEDEDLDEEEEE